MTLATLPAAVEKYATAFESTQSAKRSQSPEWLNSLRDQAWSTFSELGLPTKRRGNELWKYTNLRPLADADFSLGTVGKVSVEQIKSNAPWDDSWDTVVLVYGGFSSHLYNQHGADGQTKSSIAQAI